MKFKSLIIILLSLTINISAQTTRSAGDINYRDEVQTVMLHPTGFDLDKPVIYLNNMKEQLHLQFDVFADDAPYLYYTLVHCDSSRSGVDCVSRTAIIRTTYGESDIHLLNLDFGFHGLFLFALRKTQQRHTSQQQHRVLA